MALSAFPYIGGKTTLSSWIVGHLPAHTVYVEPFGGSAAVLLNKPRSHVEVYNDLDGDVVHFFRVARERPDELAAWCRRVPFTEAHHAEWVEQFYAGERPADDVERAGRFLFLRYCQFGGKYHAPSGFKRDTRDARPSRTWATVPERIDAVCERLQGVSIRATDFEQVIEEYDAPDAVFYCDPPYLDKELYRTDDMDHAALDAALSEIEGRALVSYTERPEGLYEGWHVERREAEHRAGARVGSTKTVNEVLLCNFDPAEAEPFGQKRLDGW